MSKAPKKLYTTPEAQEIGKLSKQIAEETIKTIQELIECKGARPGPQSQMEIIRMLSSAAGLRKLVKIDVENEPGCGRTIQVQFNTTGYLGQASL